MRDQHISIYLLLHALLLPLLCHSACGSSSQETQDASSEHPAQMDALLHPDGGATADTAASDSNSLTDIIPPDQAGGDTPADPWPPPQPWHSGKTCTLPPCDPHGAVAVDLSGSWSQTLITLSHTCNPIIATFNDRLKPGHSETKTGITSARAGECVYKDTVGGTLIGVIKGNILITCEVLPPEQGVTPLVESMMTFSGNSAVGQAWTYLFDVPVPPSECLITFDATMHRE